MSNLATYRLPQRQTHQRWLDSCIRDAVAHLDEAPFLQAMCSTPDPDLQRFNISSEVAGAPQLWESIVQHLSGCHSSSILYVSPVDSGRGPADAEAAQAVSCLSADACDTAREVLTGVATGDSSPLLSGSVGRCCDGHSAASATSAEDAFKHGYAKASAIVPYVPLRRGSSDFAAADGPPEPEGRMRAGGIEEGQVQRLWGVVVQSREHGHMEGCYVLKTSHSTSADCQCTHYSLTRICEGTPLEQQLMQAWL